MNKSQPNKLQISVGDMVTLDESLVTWPGVLQLSFDKTYEVVNIGRAHNPLNDHIYVRNDHGRVVAYLRRLFLRTEKSYIVMTDQGVFKGAPMIYVNPYGQRIIILAIPEYQEKLSSDSLAGVVLLDETEFREVGSFDKHFNKNFFTEIR